MRARERGPQAGRHMLVGVVRPPYPGSSATRTMNRRAPRKCVGYGSECFSPVGLSAKTKFSKPMTVKICISLGHCDPRWLNSSHSGELVPHGCSDLVHPRPTSMDMVAQHRFSRKCPELFGSWTRPWARKYHLSQDLGGKRTFRRRACLRHRARGRSGTQSRVYCGLAVHRSVQQLPSNRARTACRPPVRTGRVAGSRPANG
jgi:hypothetical protein